MSFDHYETQKWGAIVLSCFQQKQFVVGNTYL